MQRQATGTLGDGDVVATIDDEVGAQLRPRKCCAQSDNSVPEFIRFSVYFRLLYHCFLFIAVFLMSISVHLPFLS